MKGRNTHGHTWAIVLAAGEGTRLSSLTRDRDGNVVPKQFCSLNGSVSLLHQTLARAATVVSRERVTVVVSPAHVQFWKPALRDVVPENIIVQPLNRGTAVGILLPTLNILARDPEACILILPSDHHVADESILENAMRQTIDDIRHHLAGVALLGIEAHETDPELGYIIPRVSRQTRLRSVQRFVEKPPTEEANRLRGEGALWNTFILVCRAQSLVELYRHSHPEVVHSLQTIALCNYAQLLQVYCEFPEIEFSRHVATGQEQRLAVMAVPQCGWSDLGTPRKLAQILIRSQKQRPAPATSLGKTPDGCLNLAELHWTATN